MTTLSNEVLVERLNTHIEADKDKHDELEETGGRLLSEVARLSTRVEVLNATLAPFIEHYMAEHPSKVHDMRVLQAQASGPPIKAKRKPMSQETVLLGALVTFLTVASQVLQMLLNRH